MKIEKRRKISGVWGKIWYGKAKGCDEEKSCTVYHNAVDMDSVDGFFVDEFFAENRKRAFLRWSVGLVGNVDWREDIADV